MDDLGDLDPRLYARALDAAGERDSARNRAIAASDWWVFAQAGGGGEDEAVAALVRGLQSCERRAERAPAPE
jgi:hypothetical protein